VFAVKYIVCNILKSNVSPHPQSCSVRSFWSKNTPFVSREIHGVSDAVFDCWYCTGLLAGSDSIRQRSTLCGSYCYRITESQNGRGWKGPLWQSRLHRTLSRRVLNLSREGDSTASLGSLFQCSVTLRGKKFFLMFRRNFLCFSLCPLPLVLLLSTTEKSLAPSS